MRADDDLKNDIVTTYDVICKDVSFLTYQDVLPCANGPGWATPYNEQCCFL